MENPRFYNIGFYSGSLCFGSRQNDFVTMSGRCLFIVAMFIVAMSIVVMFVTFVIVVFAFMIMITTFVLMFFCFMIMTFVSVAGFTIARA